MIKAIILMSFFSEKKSLIFKTILNFNFRNHGILLIKQTSQKLNQFTTANLFLNLASVYFLNEKLLIIIILIL